MGVPLLLSNRGYALFFDNPSDARLAVGRSDNGVASTTPAGAGRLAWYFLIGGDLRGRDARWPSCSGHAPLPPRWALGLPPVDPPLPRHGRAAPAAAHDPREAHPVRRLIYLSTYGEALGWNRGVGHLEFQPELWPDPAALLGETRGSSTSS